MSFLEVSSLCAGYGSNRIVNNLSFSMEPGLVLGILGANGCGKTTALKALCGILPASGSVRLSGQDLTRLSPRQLARLCRYIPQRTGITIDLPVLDAVLMGFNPELGLLEYPSAAMQQRAREMLEQVGLSGFADRNFQTLSEGQKQLVILARTLAADSRLLLLDEPESALDFGGRYRMLRMVRRWVSAGQRGSVVTLHDPQLALNSCDRLLILTDGCVSAEIDPRKDSTEEIAKHLSRIYGPVDVRSVSAGSGESQLVLVSGE